RKARILKRRQQNWRPTISGLTGPWISRRMTWRISVRITVLSGSNDDAKLDRRIGGSHLLNVIGRAQRVSVGVVWISVGVCFPIAIVLVANFPILKAEMIGHI